VATESAKYPAADYGADNPKDDIQKKTLARAIDDLTTNEARDQA